MSGFLSATAGWSFHLSSGKVKQIPGNPVNPVQILLKNQDLSHNTAERLRRAIAINLVIAWRIMLMTLMGRETPELPAEVMFSDIELKILQAHAKKNA